MKDEGSSPAERMNVVLTSDFPATAHPRVLERMRASAPAPRIAWIAPFTDPSGERFRRARERFAALGFDDLECCDIDHDADEVQLAYLREFDIVFLSGGDAVRFRRNLLRTGLGGRLRQCLSAGRLVVAAGGGAMQLTANVSIARLSAEPIETVLAEHSAFDAIGVVPYELVLHADRCTPGFVTSLQRYSETVAHDILLLADGAALLHHASSDFDSVGDVRRYRHGAAVP